MAHSEDDGIIIAGNMLLESEYQIQFLTTPKIRKGCQKWF